MNTNDFATMTWKEWAEFVLAQSYKYADEMPICKETWEQLEQRVIDDLLYGEYQALLSNPNQLV